MKKILVLPCIIFTLFTSAQTGSVGIGTTAPDSNAILELQSTNKGLLLPRVALIHTDSVQPLTAHVQGMSVYNTQDINNVSKGYYYNDGTKWVKLTTNKEQLWEYQLDSSRIVLKFQGLPVPPNEVYYDNTNGSYRNISNNANAVNIFEWNPVTSTYTPVVKNFLNNKAKEVFISNSNDNPINNFSSVPSKNMKVEAFIVSSLDTTKSQRSVNTSTVVPSDNSNNYNYVYDLSNNVDLSGTGNVQFSIANANSVNIYNSQNITGYGAGTVSDLRFSTTGNIANTYSLLGRQWFINSGGTIDNAALATFQGYTPLGNTNNTLVKIWTGISSTIVNSSSNTGTGVAMRGYVNILQQLSQTKYTNMIGFINSVSVGDTAVKPDYVYGYFGENVTGGLLGNYSIFTKLGKNSFGDTVEIRNINTTISSTASDKILVADANGVVKSINSTSGVSIPAGTDTERPTTPIFGTIRYNSTIGRGEMYVNDVNGDGTQGDAGWRPI